MILSLEEMNILSERLEKEEARLHEANMREPGRKEADHSLNLISSLQHKLRDVDADLTEQERAYIIDLLREEAFHIHGSGTGVYHSIINKMEL
ncbi:hypothetical protein C1X05_09730 [Laceyella sacchari]|uniref:Uncharacterized protein n=1 Tax=Laceyella tengchongensis TaxID=574699 RepID=A0AA45WS76_9BACL|nr:hypothetical protein [Laceyella tengchongensis]AUS09102.1 hypothetical protein C1X05_09730 [Laceyella sacchari]SMP35454.1 hypothetical protein SAMN06265361_1136 [Laceyella tengchongensis]